VPEQWLGGRARAGQPCQAHGSGQPGARRVGSWREHSPAPNACLDRVEILCLPLFSAVNPKGDDARNNLPSDLPWPWGMINDKPLRILAAKHTGAMTVASWGNKHLV